MLWFPATPEGGTNFKTLIAPALATLSACASTGSEGAPAPAFDPAGCGPRDFVICFDERPS
jgi:hypothetical protein